VIRDTIGNMSFVIVGAGVGAVSGAAETFVPTGVCFWKRSGVGGHYLSGAVLGLVG